MPKTATILRKPNPFFTQKIPFWLTPSLVPDLPLDLKDTHQHPSQKMLSPSVSHHACCGGNHTRPKKNNVLDQATTIVYVPRKLSTKEFRKKGSGFQDCVFSTQLLPKKCPSYQGKHQKEGRAKLKNWISSLQVIWRKLLCFHFVKLFSSGVFLVVWRCFFPTFLQGAKVSSFWCKSSALPLTSNPSVKNARAENPPIFVFFLGRKKG